MHWWGYRWEHHQGIHAGWARCIKSSCACAASYGYGSDIDPIGFTCTLSAVVSPTRLEETTALDLITEAIDIRGAHSNGVGDDFWNDFEERIAWGEGGYDHGFFEEAAA